MAKHDRIVETHNRRGNAAKKTTTERMVSIAVDGPSSGIICHLVARSAEELRHKKAQKGSHDQLILGQLAAAKANITLRIVKMKTLKLWTVSPKERERSSVTGNNHKTSDIEKDPKRQRQPRTIGHLRMTTRCNL